MPWITRRVLITVLAGGNQLEPRIQKSVSAKQDFFSNPALKARDFLRISALKAQDFLGI